MISDINVQKEQVKRNGITVDGRHYNISFKGKLAFLILLYCLEHGNYSCQSS